MDKIFWFKWFLSFGKKPQRLDKRKATLPERTAVNFFTKLVSKPVILMTWYKITHYFVSNNTAGAQRPQAGLAGVACPALGCRSLATASFLTESPAETCMKHTVEVNAEQWNKTIKCDREREIFRSVFHKQKVNSLVVLTNGTWLFD